MMTEDEHGQLKALAWRTLKAVDHIDAKAADEGLSINTDWRAWRSQVRAVIRGERLDIPNEPPRYGDAYKAHWQAPAPQQPSEPPAEALLEAYPDEDHAALKARILGEFASLRNMLIGQIPMTHEQLDRLVALEHPKYQSWLQGVTK